MVSGNRKRVEPQRRQHEVYPNLDYYDWSSADDLSALAYALRKVKKSDISRLCDNHEIEFIETRFEDTSRVIFKDLEQLNLPLLQRAYKRPLKSDIVAIQGIRISSAISNKSVIIQGIRRKIPSENSESIPTIEEIWDAGNPPVNNTIKQSSSTSRHTTIAKNAVSPAAAEEIQTQQRQENGQGKSKAGGGRRGGGICRVT